MLLEKLSNREVFFCILSSQIPHWDFNKLELDRKVFAASASEVLYPYLTEYFDIQFEILQTLYLINKGSGAFINPKIRSEFSMSDHRLVKQANNFHVVMVTFKKIHKRAYSLDESFPDEIGYYMTPAYFILPCNNSLQPEGFFLEWQNNIFELNLKSSVRENTHRFYKTEMIINREEIEHVYNTWQYACGKHRKLVLIFEDQLMSFGSTVAEAGNRISECLTFNTHKEFPVHIDFLICARAMCNAPLQGTYIQMDLISKISGLIDEGTNLFYVDGRPGIGKSHFIDAMCSLKTLSDVFLKHLPEPVFLLYSSIYTADIRSELTCRLRRLQLILHTGCKEVLVTERSELSAGFLYDPVRRDSKALEKLLYDTSLTNEFNTFLNNNNMKQHFLFMKDGPDNEIQDHNLDEFSRSKWCKRVNDNALNWFKKPDAPGFTIVSVNI